MKAGWHEMEGFAANALIDVTAATVSSLAKSFALKASCQSWTPVIAGA